MEVSTSQCRLKLIARFMSANTSPIPKQKISSIGNSVEFQLTERRSALADRTTPHQQSRIKEAHKRCMRLGHTASPNNEKPYTYQKVNVLYFVW
jgi:hypothetical protein